MTSSVRKRSGGTRSEGRGAALPLVWRRGLPLGTGQGVLDQAVLGSVDVVQAVAVEGPDEGQTGLVHDAPGAVVDRHRLRDDPLHTELGEALADQRDRALGPVA